MPNPANEQPGAHPSHSYSQSNPDDPGSGYSAVYTSLQRGRSLSFFISGLSTGFLVAVLLGGLAYFLVIRPRNQNALAPTTPGSNQTVAIVSDPQSVSNPQLQATNEPSPTATVTPPQSQASFTSPSGSAATFSSAASPEFSSAVNADQFNSGVVPLHNFSGLNLEERHPNGTILRVNGISIHSDTIAVQLAVTNSHRGKIKLNEIWATTESTMVLADHLGNEYRVLPPPGNQEIEVEPGRTERGEFIFLGKLDPSATKLTLTTNSRGGLPNNSITNKPQISVQIPLYQ